MACSACSQRVAAVASVPCFGCFVVVVVVVVRHSTAAVAAANGSWAVGIAIVARPTDSSGSSCLSSYFGLSFHSFPFL